ncbi:MAG: hypothetical protein GY926_23465 [bacterium]|nr:hypothetical protein [bacterium]
MDSSKSENPDSELTITELRQLALDVDGVANVEVDLREDGRPRLRVWLDGSIEAVAVGDHIESLVAQAFVAATPEPAAPAHRTGLGRTLDELMAAAHEELPPTQLVPKATEIEAVQLTRLALVAVEETAGGISVRASDSAGGISFSPVSDPRSLNQAVVSAVARLRRERPVPRLAGVELRDVEGAPVLTVVLAHTDGRCSVGASLVEGGMPFTLGRAVWEALVPTG